MEDDFDESENVTELEDENLTDLQNIFGGNLIDEDVGVGEDSDEEDPDDAVVARMIPRETSANHSAALFLLTLQEKYRLSQKAIDFAIGSVGTIIDNVFNSIKLSTTETFEDPFSSLKTGYQQTKFYCEEFGLVVSFTV